MYDSGMARKSLTRFSKQSGRLPYNIDLLLGFITLLARLVTWLRLVLGVSFVVLFVLCVPDTASCTTCAAAFVSDFLALVLR